MLNENAKKWVEALRSGVYHQASGCLRDGASFCCLGVASDLYIKNNGEAKWDGSAYIPSSGDDDDSQYEILHSEVQEWLGLDDTAGKFNASEFDLAGLNDNGSTFTEIADLIESEPEGLFKPLTGVST